MLEERKSELLRELEGHYSCKQVAMSVYSQKAQETVDKLYQVQCTCNDVPDGVPGTVSVPVMMYLMVYQVQ